MEIILRSRSKRKKQKVQRDHYWYDPKTKQMLHGHGGEMRFDRNRTPYIVDIENWQWLNDYDDILAWTKKNAYRISILNTAKGHFVLIDVVPDIVDEIIYDLTQNDIMFEEWS